MTYACSSDVAALWAKDLSVEETAMVDRRLQQVERMIKRRIPDLDAQVDSGAIAEEDLVDVEAEAVLRHVRNPEGLTMEMDGAYQYQRSKDAANSSLRLTAVEWQVLGLSVGRMFSIGPSIGGTPL